MHAINDAVAYDKKHWNEITKCLQLNTVGMVRGF